MKEQRNLIKYLNKHYARHNVFFGKIIHDLKPKDLGEWKQHLIEHKWYLIGGLGKKGFTNKDKSDWCRYIKNSFWKLYVSETTAIKFLKDKYDWDLEFAPRSLDIKYGIDFEIKGKNVVSQNSKSFLIVKTSLYKDETKRFLRYKQLDYFCYKGLNHSNTDIWVFVSSALRIYKYDHCSKDLVDYTDLAQEDLELSKIWDELFDL